MPLVDAASVTCHPLGERANLVGGFFATIYVVETHYVVLTQIASNLHLNQLQINLPRVREPMMASDRDIDQFIFVNILDCVVHGNFRRPTDDNPMLGAVEMLLERQCGAWLDDYTLYFEPACAVDLLEVAPGAMDPPMLNGGWMISELNFVNERFKLLGVAACRDQHCICGGDNDHIVKTYHGGKDGVPLNELSYFGCCE